MDLQTHIRLNLIMAQPPEYSAIMNQIEMLAMIKETQITMIVIITVMIEIETAIATAIAATALTTTVILKRTLLINQIDSAVVATEETTTTLYVAWKMPMLTTT